MQITEHIEEYLRTLKGAKQADMRALHAFMLERMSHPPLWFLDGKNEEGKVVSNPNIGYGSSKIHYADGTHRDFYRFGISANTGGISMYVMGLSDKTFLQTQFGNRLGKASITGYCIKFKTFSDLNLEVLEELVGWEFG